MLPLDLLEVPKDGADVPRGQRREVARRPGGLAEPEAGERGREGGQEVAQLGRGGRVPGVDGRVVDVGLEALLKSKEPGKLLVVVLLRLNELP